MQQKVTVWQRAILLVLMHAQWQAEREASEALEDIVCWLSRGALEHAVWFHWQTHHSLKMQQLIDERWVSQMTIDGVIYYRIKKTAYDVLRGHWSGVEWNRHVRWFNPNAQPTLPGMEQAPF